MAKKKKPTTQKLNNAKAATQRFFSNKSNHTIFGFVLIFLALFIFGAVVSYFNNWSEDQNLLRGNFFELLGNDSYKVNNVLGKIGAALAHQLVFHWFGVSAIFISWFLFLLGVKIGLNVVKVRLLKHLGGVIFFLLWIPTSLAFLWPSKSIWAGANGFFTEQWLHNAIGGVGTALALFLSIMVFLVVRFKWTAETFKLWFARFKKKETSDLEDFSDATPETAPVQEVVTTEPEPNPVQVNFEDGKEAETKEPEVKQETFELDIKEEPAATPPPAPPVEETPVLESTSDLEIEKEPEEEQLSEKEVNRKVKEFGEYDPTLELSKFKLPPIELLKEFKQNGISINQQELEANKNKIVETLNNYKIEISKIKATIGPTVTLYEIVPAAGVRISKIKNLEDDIALSLSALGIRIIAPIPGRGTIGIEVPNTNPQVVSMRNLLKSEKFQTADMELPIAFGKTISNETLMADLAKMPHLLMAGATGQGKSVGLNVILTSILYKKHPSQVKFILVDPKKVELTLFNKIERHYLAKLPDSEEAIITDTKKVINTLNSLCIEMDNRYDLLKNAMCRNIKEYNHKFVNRRLNPEEGHKFLPYIVLVIDEFADLIMTAGKEVETPIARLAQLARAIGIHLIVATQRPSVNVITGIIKANFPARIAFRVTSRIDSRTILDAGGADQLIGKGDMLYSSGQDLVRIQCAFVDTPEIEEITDYIGNQKAYPEAYMLPEYVGEDENPNLADAANPADRDALFEDAARVIVMHQQGSTSLLQRKLKLGYNRAGRIVDQLEAAGIIGPFEGSKARQVLIPDEMALEQLLKNEQNNLNGA